MNPYKNYIISFCVALVAFSLGWSGIYPPLTLALLCFLAGTFLAHGVLAYYWNKLKLPTTHFKAGNFSPVYVTVFLYLLWAVDFLYEGGIPLVKIWLHQPYNYRQFGVPSLHVFTVTFASFYTVYLFSLFVQTRERKYLVLYGINLVAALLIYSRAMFLFNAFSSLAIYFLILPGLRWKRISWLAGGALILAYGFGWMGTLRVSAEAKEKYNSNLFLALGEASPAFTNSFLPAEFFWAYIYLSSPLANLQHNINTFPVQAVTPSRVLQMVNNEMIPDFLSKRVNKIFGVERTYERTLPDKPFNVSTVYSRSFSYLGWSGIILMGFYVLVAPWLYIRWLPDNAYSMSGLAILNTMYFFLFYDNTLRFTGLSLQLAYPFLMPVAEKTYAWAQKKITP